MNREKILQTIFNHFQCMTQWVTIDPILYAEYYSQAKSLIELVETDDTGSIGRNRFKPIESGFELYDRFLVLVKRKDTKLKKELYFDTDSMKSYWLEISNKREDYNI